MAPLPQTSATSPSTSPEPAPSTLPGLKRGIAVGVASSVCLILIALLAVFILRRRKKRKQQQQADELPAWSDGKAPPPPEKIWIPVPSSPIEADTGTIYELDADQIPELPTRVHTPAAQELHADSAGDSLGDLKGQIAAMKESDERRGASEASEPRVPTLRISAPELSPLTNTSGFGTSPLSVSPLEEAYLPQSPRSSQRWP